MQGEQHYQPQLFSMIQLESLIPEKHLLRKIDKILDLSFIREMTESLYCDNNGRPSIDPELFFRICLIIYFYDIPSDRQACEEIQYNMAYRWFCKLSLEDRVPDHSSLTRIRDRLGETTFKKIFNKIVQITIDKGLTKGQKIMMDGSLVKADAALRSLVERSEDGKPSDKPSPKYIKGQKFSNKKHVSKTDPDCALAGKVGEPKQLRYKVHSSIDRDSRVIVDAHVTDGAETEGKVMMSRLDETKKIFGFNFNEVTADRGYGYGENLQALKDRNITSRVPRLHEDVGDRVARDSEGFEYNEEKDFFSCPQGHELHPIQGPTPEYKRYRIKGGHCANCPLKKKCFTLNTHWARNAKHIEVHIYHEVIDEAAKMEVTEEFKKIRGERQWKMEGIFAEAKDNHGLRRARYRGRAKMQIQAYIVACVQNIKRLIDATLEPEFIIGFLRFLNNISEKIAQKNYPQNLTLKSA